MTDAEGNSEPTNSRESIWSIPAGWRVAYFAIFSISYLASACAIVLYRIANREDAHPVEVLVTIAENVSVVGIAMAITTVAIMEVIQLPMVIANYIRVKLVEPLKEQLRDEGWERGREQGRDEGREQGREEGREEGREQGSAQTNAAWQEWNERRMRADANGVQFDEPPPQTG